ncbi:site-specific integrase [Sphingomonas xanthus]|uniref:Site-specific integrase n=1 Tax=Sphingomonas xanthus TaxID=2594473 RepID=A0A516IU43_9SPHN|nr:site-specific integrase [Sphingomonas xanthus]QDP20446.1 site-specific integrase [Sphingomonas xanthus]
MLNLIEFDDVSPFNGVNVGTSAGRPAFLDGFEDSLGQLSSRLPSVHMGQMLCSAIVYGALLDPTSWDAWCESCHNYMEGQAGGHLENMAWIDTLLLDRSSPKGISTRRWYADPVTRALLKQRRFQWKHLPKLIRETQAIGRQCLSCFLEHLNPKQRSERDRVDELLEWAVCHWRLRLPPLMLSQARGELPTVALDTKRYLELLGWDARNVARASEKLIRPLGVEPDYRLSEHQAASDWYWAYKGRHLPESYAFADAKNLRRIGQKSHIQEKTVCISLLGAVAKKTGTSEARKQLIAWCQDLLEIRRAPASRRGFSLYTVEQRLVVMLQGIFEGQDVHDLSQVSRASIFRRARAVRAKTADPTKRTLLGVAARSYSDFIRRRAGKRVGGIDFIDPLSGDRENDEGLDDNSLLDAPYEAAAGDGSPTECEHNEHGAADDDLYDDFGPAGVSASLVSPDTYRAAVQYAYANSQNGELALMIMLAFRAGLRIAEILKLETSQVIEHDYLCELHLDDSRYGAMKTRHSRRVVPLDVLLNGNELKTFRRWLRPRQDLARTTGKPQLIFGPLGSRTPLQETVATKRIEQALNSDGQTKLRFAACRHSFGSYLLLQMLLPEHWSELLVPRAIRNSTCYWRQNQLQNRLLGYDNLGQATVQAVSQLMGHTGVYRTLNSYVHLLDMAVGLYVNQSANLPSVPIAVANRLNLPTTPPDVPEWPKNASRSAFRTRIYSRVADFHRPQIGEVQICVATGNATPGEWPVGAIGGDPLLPKQPRGPKASTGKDSRKSLAPKKKQGGPSKWAVVQTEHVEPVKEGSGLDGTDASPDARPLVDWRLLWSLVTKVEEDAAALASLHSIAAPKVKTWRKRYQANMAASFEAGPRPSGLTAPRGPAAEAMIQKLWERSEILGDDDKELVRTFLNGFIPNRFLSRMRMKTAESFVALLNKLGVPEDHVAIADGPDRDVIELKKNPRLMTRTSRNGATFRAPINEAAARAKNAKLAAVWFDWLLDEGTVRERFGTRHILDDFQERKDAQLAEAGNMTEQQRARREKAAIARQEGDEARRSDGGIPRYAIGKHAYRFYLNLVAIYFDLEIRPKHKERYRAPRQRGKRSAGVPA